MWGGLAIKSARVNGEGRAGGRAGVYCSVIESRLQVVAVVREQCVGGRGAEQLCCVKAQARPRDAGMACRGMAIGATRLCWMFSSGPKPVCQSAANALACFAASSVSGGEVVVSLGQAQPRDRHVTLCRCRDLITCASGTVGQAGFLRH